MSIWFTEKQTPYFGITAQVRCSLVHEKTPYQKLDLIETEEFGKMLLLDDMVMTTEKDEFVYHEMMAHVPMFTHPKPVNVLVVGGGDGGVVREVLKHPSVECVTLAEIDGAVIEYSKTHLPKIAGMLDDPRVDVKVGDGFMHIAEARDAYDVIMVDSTEPVGPAAKLFEKGFYEGISRALTKDGVFVAQTDNPWFKAELIRQVYQDVSEIFPITRVYTANVPTYPSGMWTFTIGSKTYDPCKVSAERFHSIESQYYTSSLHHASFVLPRFVERLLEEASD
ncbi:polyamine aminopropyltransferase [Bacillaceae bacterium SIJ1]|uniref:polyamine aminopropyltransferase n=1 Tax=Litoribacterium kuwaitense TaxID=1398745 RepID=UPI0013ED3CDE|nr:polyamine aminopropyltransferase [Litoribacterium kuwaitense]NGP44703.1 polyamine aminopropyltransferase [Litoribacterium kuwaitense]